MEAGGKTYIEHGSRADEFRVWNLADLHWLSTACAEDQIRTDVATIAADPYSFWIGGGDYADFIGYTDKRFDPDVVAPWVKIADMGRLGQFGMECVRDVLLPIKDKCLGLLLGNHEKRYSLKTEHEGLHGWLCTELDASNWQYSVLFDLVFARAGRIASPRLRRTPPKHGKISSRSFRIFAHHGAGYAQTPGGKLNRLIRFMDSFDADIYFCGHVHDQVGRRQPTIGADADCQHLRAKERVGVISGSYLKTYQQGATTYGEQRGYRPTCLGAAVVTINPDKMTVRGEV